MGSDATAHKGVHWALQNRSKVQQCLGGSSYSLGIYCASEMKHTGWPQELLQDDSRELSRWFASRMDARRCVRVRVMEIEMGIINNHVDVDALTDKEVRVVLGLLVRQLGLHIRLTNQTQQCRKHDLPPELALMTEDEAFE